MLLDLLYGELDADAAQVARSAIDADDDMRTELAEFQSLRGFMRALPDVEPPPAITAKLLHAAATGVPAAPKVAVAAADVGAAAGVGGFFAWLKRLFEPMMMHPGLAAAASLVLVVGLAGAMYLSGKSQIAEPQVSKTSAVDSKLAPATDEAVRGSSEDRNPAPTAPVPPAATAPRPADLNADMPSDPLTLRPDEGAGKSYKKELPRKSNERRGGAARTSLDDKAATGPGSSARRSRVQAMGGSGGSTVKPKPRSSRAPARTRPRAPSIVTGTSGSTISAEPAPPPELKTMDEEKAPSQAPATKKQSPQKPQKNKVPVAVRLHREARAAAKKRDCKYVKALALRIRKLDSRYYDTKFLGDASLRACLRAPSQVAK